MFNNDNKNNYGSNGVPEYMAYGGVPVGLPNGAVPENATNGAIPQWAVGQQNGNPNYILDNDLYNKMWNTIKRFEGLVNHPYLDTKGYITTGAGANVNNLNDFMNVNFMVNGIPATYSQKLSAYNYLRQLSDARDINGNYLYRNYNKTFFEDKTNLSLSDADAFKMAKNHMVSDLSHVRREFKDFDAFPIPLKEILLDLHYNTGNLTQSSWPNLYKAIENKDVFGENGIVANVNRKNVSQERNDWARDTARLIRF